MPIGGLCAWKALAFLSTLSYFLDIGVTGEIMFSTDFSNLFYFSIDNEIPQIDFESGWYRSRHLGPTFKNFFYTTRTGTPQVNKKMVSASDTKKSRFCYAINVCAFNFLHVPHSNMLFKLRIVECVQKKRRILDWM